MKRLSLSFLTVLLTSLAFAGGEGFAGTKASTTSTMASGGQSGFGVMPLVQMAIAVGIVMFLLKAVLPRVVTKLNKRLVTNVNGAIRIEESAQFAGGTLYVVQAKSKTLLLSVSTGGVNCLADITEANPQPAPKTFQEMVEDAPGELPVFAISEVEERPANDIEAALERLQRLSG